MPNEGEFSFFIEHLTNILNDLHTKITITNLANTYQVSLKSTNKKDIIQFGASRNKHTTFASNLGNEVVKKDLSLVMCLKQPLSKCHLLGALALNAVNTILHLGLSFLNHTCLTIMLDLVLDFFSLSKENVEKLKIINFGLKSFNRLFTPF